MTTCTASPIPTGRRDTPHRATFSSTAKPQYLGPPRNSQRLHSRHAKPRSRPRRRRPKKRSTCGHSSLNSAF
eukprot:4277583-Pleurochrysis_carterae.AAC.1